MISLDSSWRYLQRPVQHPNELDSVPTDAWERVDLPHTWNRFDATDMTPGYRRDAGWYRRTLDLAGFANGARFVLYFEGANTVTDVYVNGKRAGGHVGGYVGFDVDITPFVTRNAPNDIEVRVDNSDDRTLIPSDMSDFVIFGGIVRDVWLNVVPSAYISRLELRTPQVTQSKARTTALMEIANPEGRTVTFTAGAVITDPRGDVVARSSASVILTSAATQSVAIDLPVVTSPKLWSPSSPTLYTVSVTLTQPSGTVVDRVSDKIGYRWYSFQPNGPFYLNGKRLLLRGTHRHEENAAYGAAMPNVLHRQDMADIKALGANFVRLAHYPQDPEVYRAADSLGLLLWDELPWCRGGLGGPEWQANTKRLLVEQIRQNMNHPSIVMWSLGNEVADVIDPANSGDPAVIKSFLAELNAIAHRLDPGRPTAMRKFDEGASEVDVYSPSIWAGWYRGVYHDYEKALLDARSRWPRFVHMEYGADAHPGRHSETPLSGEGLQVDSGYAESVGKQVKNVARDGDWSESYQTDLLDWYLMISERESWLTGNAQWAFRDFATPLRPEDPIPYVNEKGLVDRAGHRKDSYYVFRSYWTESPKFAYIVSHTWTERSGPSGKPREVRVYSNCAAVELRLNATSHGVRKRVRNDFPAQGLRWSVLFDAGANQLTARCAGTGERAVADSVNVHYSYKQAGKPDHIELSPVRLPDGHLLVHAIVVDAQGRHCLTFAGRIYFSYSGSGKLLADRGTPNGSSVIEASDGHAAIELVPPDAGLRGEVLARTQDINGTRLVLDDVTVAHSPAVDSTAASRQ